MRTSIRAVRCMVVLMALPTACARTSHLPEGDSETRRVLIIGHRGASGHLPEHTIAGYALAIAMGADFIEPDLVITKDGALIARHEHRIDETTDVAAKFPERRTTKHAFGKEETGWFAEDFTLAEVKTLRAKERLPFRSHAHDGEYEIPTLEEILDLVERTRRETGRTVGIYPETKHAFYYRALGLPLEEPLVAALARRGLTERTSAVFLQSFHRWSLERLRTMTRVRLIQLVDDPGADDDRIGGQPSFAEMATADGLRAIARYADGVGPDKRLIIPLVNGHLAPPTSFVRDAHAVGLLVHPWTMRSDSAFLAADYRGDPLAEYRQLQTIGVDGLFSDFADDAVRALRAARR